MDSDTAAPRPAPAPLGGQLLPRVQYVFFGLLATGSGIAAASWWLSPAIPHGRSWPMLVAVVWLVAQAWRLLRGSEPRLVGDLVSAVATGYVVWAIGLEPASSILYVGMIHRGLYGRLPGVVTALALQIAAMAGGVFMAGLPLSPNGLLTNAAGFTAVSGAFHLLASTLRRYETSSQARFQALVRGSSDVLAITDADTLVDYVSPSLVSVFGFADGQVPGGTLLGWVQEADRPTVSAQLAALLADPGATASITCRVPDAAGTPRHVEMALHNGLTDPDVRALVVNVRDVTSRVELADQLRHQALHDALTGLANRALFADRLEQALGRRNARAAVLLVDLDGFKAVNDTFGHPAGDALLVGVAERLSSVVRGGDTVARLGGDEFAILLIDTDRDDGGAELVASRVLAALATRLPLHRRGDARPGAGPGSTHIAASIGVAVAVPGSFPEELLREADLALYKAKAAGKGRLEVYHAELHTEAAQRLELETSLHLAVDRCELVLHYQPIYALGTGELVGVEALVRWEHPVRGLVSPAEFIPLAERTGLIVPIGAWVLQEACRQVASWQRQEPTAAPLRVSVNLSTRQFDDPNLVATVEEAVRAAGLAPDTLTLEITETALARDPKAVAGLLHRLRALGLRIAVDDFGTGYNALSYLQDYPIDELKIDRSFVDRLTAADSDAVTITSAIIAMGRALHLSTVGEGIESDEQRDRLTDLGCDLGQGYRLSRPLTGDALETLLAARSTVPAVTTTVTR